MKFATRNVVVGISLSLALTVVFSPQLFAVDGGRVETTTTRVSDKVDNVKGEQRKEVAREKLDAKRLTLCESRQSVVNTAMTNVIDRSKTHFDRITAIYTKATKFYVAKNLSIDNYEALVLNADSAKAAAEAANKELTNLSQFSCGSTGPKADIQVFRNKRLDKVDAFNVYRDAVKALVGAMRDAAKVTEPTTKDGNADAVVEEKN